MSPKRRLPRDRSDGARPSSTAPSRLELRLSNGAFSRGLIWCDQWRIRVNSGYSRRSEGGWRTRSAMGPRENLLSLAAEYEERIPCGIEAARQDQTKPLMPWARA